MKRLRKIFRRLRSFRPRCLCAEDDDTRCQSPEEVYQRSGDSDVGLKPKPEAPAEPSEAFFQLILPGQCEELMNQEELNVPAATELNLQDEELLGSSKDTYFSAHSVPEVEHHVLAEPKGKPEIEALPDPQEAASSSDFAELEQDLHELQREVEIFLGSSEDTYFSALSDPEEEQHVLAEPKGKPEIEAHPDPQEAAFSSDFAELEQDLHELQREVEIFLGSSEDTYFSALSDPEEEQHVLAEPKGKPEIEAHPDPQEAAFSSDFAELEQDLHELQREVEIFLGSSEDTYFSALSDPEEEQHVLGVPKVKSEIEALPGPPGAAASSDSIKPEQHLYECQHEVEAFFGSSEDTDLSALSDPEEEQYVLAEPEIKPEIEALLDPSEAASSCDFAVHEQALHKLKRIVQTFLDALEVPCFSKLSDSEVPCFYELSDSEEEQYILAEQEVRPALSEATSGLRDFRCCAVLGEGAFGKVLLAEYKQTQDLFAIKAITKAGVIRRRHTARLRCEKEIFQTVSSVRHPFLVNLVTSFQDEHYIFFVMEYAAGGDLRSNQPRFTRLFPQDRAVFYVACVVLGLEFLHQNKIIHRDLKLQNVVLDKEGFAKLTDFGLSKAGIGFGDRTKSIVGTPRYMAPEMVTMQPYTRDVDWWSLGILIYYMLAAKTPFDAHDIENLNHNIVNSEVMYPQDWSPESISLVSQLLVKNPSQRLGSSKKDAEDVKTHPFFRDIDWRKLFLRELRPPFLPPLSGPEDVSNFDALFTSMDPILTSPEEPGLTQEQQDLFKDFDWMAEWAP